MASAKPNTPWSVKGIEKDARETAKAVAHSQGVTVGAWLNQIIYSAANPKDSGGHVDGLKAPDLVTAIEALNKRIATEEGKSAAAIDSLSRTFGGVVERLQRLERGQPIGDEDATLERRLARLEEKSGDRQRIAALTSLEKAVSQVAQQFETTRSQAFERLNAHEKQLTSVAERLDALNRQDDAGPAVDYLKNAVDGLTARLARAERIAAEAANLRKDAGNAVDAAFVERTGARLRVLGDEIKRGGDQIRSFEKSVEKLSAQIDAAERRSAEGVSKVSDTIAEIRREISTGDDDGAHRDEVEAAVADVAQRTEERLSALQKSFDHMIARIDQRPPSASEEKPAAALSAAKTKTLTAPMAADDFSALAADKAPALANPADDALQPPSTAADPFAFDDDDDDEPARQAPSLESLPPPSAIGGEKSSEAQTPPSKAAGEEPSAGHSSSDILAQVRQSVSESLHGKAAPTASAAASNDLSSVLAELEGMGFRDESGTRAPAAPADETPSAESLADQPPFADLETDRSAPPAPDDRQEPDLTAQEDGLRALADALDSRPDSTPTAPSQHANQQHARQDDEDDGGFSVRELPVAPDQGGKLTKRQLSAKQRAILAVRVRRQRLEALQAEEEEASDFSVEDDAFNPAEADDDPVASEHPAAARARDEAARATRARAQARPSPQDEDQDDDPFNDLYDLGEDVSDDDDLIDEDFVGEDDAPTSRFAARPLTLALGGAIVLAVIALGFILKDLIIGPGEVPALAARNAAPASDAPAPTIAAGPGSNERLAGGPSTPAPANDAALQIPQPPATQPRDLYFESVRALRNAISPGEEEAAIQTLKQAAALGHPPAQLQLGELYKTGQGVTVDPREARLWYERAASGGNILAMHRAGVMAAQGEGGPADMTGAIAYFENAANRALVDAQYNLGAIYHPGAEDTTNTLQNANRSYYWYTLAAKNGDDQAASLAAGIGSSLDAAVKAEIDARIAAWAPLTADAAANEISPAS